MSFVHALDFDGVICDSADETATTAIRAAKSLWPFLPDSIEQDGAPAKNFIEPLKRLRPVIETGYENVLLARIVMEGGDQDVVGDVMEDWQGIRDKVMKEWDVDKDRLVDAFGRVRDEWIAHDVDSWVAANSMYVVCLLCAYCPARDFLDGL